MKELLTKDAQSKLKEVLWPQLEKAVRAEHDKREKKAEEEIDSYKNHESVTAYRDSRKTTFTVVSKLAELHSSLDDAEKKELVQMNYRVEKYIEEKDRFIIDYNSKTDSSAENKAENEALKANGLNGHWSCHRVLDAVKTELSARLSVQKTSGFSQIVDKIMDDIDIKSFFVIEL